MFDELVWQLAYFRFDVCIDIVQPSLHFFGYELFFINHDPLCVKHSDLLGACVYQPRDDLSYLSRIDPCECLPPLPLPMVIHYQCHVARPLSHSLTHPSQDTLIGHAMHYP